MADDQFESSRRPLEPIDRISEVLFGLIMVLTFTGSLSIAEAGRAEVRTILLGALGCNLAWGLIVPGHRRDAAAGSRFRPATGGN